MKSQLVDRLMKALRSVIASNGVPYLQMKSVGLHSTSGRRKERRKGSQAHVLMQIQCVSLLPPRDRLGVNTRGC